MSDSPEPQVTVSELLDALAASGISPTALAVAAGVPVETVLERGIKRARGDASDAALTVLGGEVMRRAMEEALFLLDQGTPQIKTSIIGRVMPALIALMTEDEAAETVAEMRGELAALREEIGGPTPASEAAEGADEGSPD